jgi:hypothetical protein
MSDNQDHEAVKNRRSGRLCKVCGSPIVHAEVDEEGLCGPCGLRSRRGELPPAGSKCVVCGERRRRNLTVWPLSGDPVCHTCVFYLKEASPWPEDPTDLSWRLRRERRGEPRDEGAEGELRPAEAAGAVEAAEPDEREGSSGRSEPPPPAASDAVSDDDEEMDTLADEEDIPTLVDDR